MNISKIVNFPFFLLFLVLLCGYLNGQAGPITIRDTRTLAEIREEQKAKGLTQPADSAVLFKLPGQDNCRVATRVYHETMGSFDIYYPAGYDFTDPIPAIILTGQYTNKELKSGFGVTFREYQQPVDWASLFAAKGFAAILYDIGQPFFSAKEVLLFLEKNATQLHIDPEKLGIFAVSANTQVASLLLSKTDIPAVKGIKATAFLYGATYGFDLPSGKPVFLIIRAGRDDPQFLSRTDSFVDRLKAAGHNVILLQYDEGVHGFDTKQDSTRSRDIVLEVLNFFSEHLKQ